MPAEGMGASAERMPAEGMGASAERPPSGFLNVEGRGLTMPTLTIYR